MKRTFPSEFSQGNPAMRPRKGGEGGMNNKFTMKLLLSEKEASVVLGPGGSISREIGQQTGTKLHLSNRREYYPGTNLQEMDIRGPEVQPVSEALYQVVTRIYEDGGRISGGDGDVEDGVCRIRVVVPTAAAKAIIGRGGDNIKSLRQYTGLRVHIEEVAIGQGDTAEQVVILQGTYEATQGGLPNIVEKVSEFMSSPWFQVWVNISNAGMGGAETTPMNNGKGQGKTIRKGDFVGGGKIGAREKGSSFKGGKGEFDGGFGGHRQVRGNMFQSHPDDFPEMGKESFDYPESNSWGSVAGSGHDFNPHMGDGGDGQSMELVNNALMSLPPQLADVNGGGQCISFPCPSECVSAVIGKGGAGTKEISAATGAKIMIRGIDGNDSEKSITLTGSAPGVVSAYLFLLGRISGVQEANFMSNGAGEKQGDDMDGSLDQMLRSF